MNRKLKSILVIASALVLGGVGLAQSSGAVPASTPLTFHVQAARVFDSRDPGHTGKIVPGFALTACGPANADALAVNLTVDQPDHAGYLTAYPANGLPSATSSVNFAAGQTTSNFTIVDTGGTGCIRVASPYAATHVIVDEVGYYIP